MEINQKEHLHTDVDFYNKGVEVTTDRKSVV